MNKILIGMPSASGKPYPDCIFSIIYQEINSDIEIAFDMNSLVIGKPVQIARNELLERFVRSNCTHLLFFDDDQVMNYDVIQKLIDADKDIVSGVVPLRHGDGDGDMLNIFYEKDGRLTHYTDLSNIEEQVIEIANCGTGCVLLSRKVCQDMYKSTEGNAFAFESRPYVQNLNGDILEKYDYQDYNDNWDKKYYAIDGKIKIVNIPISEDLRFFEKAKELGYKMYADVTAICQHYEGKPKRRKIKTCFTPKTEYANNLGTSISEVSGGSEETEVKDT